MKNFEELHLFIEGMKSDFDNHAETPKTYEYGLNGRLYNHKGTIAYSSIRGTKKVLENPNIVKYLGYCAFRDELLLFVKGLPELITSDLGTIEYQEQKKILAASINVEIPYGDSDVVVSLHPHISEVTVTFPVFIPNENPFNFQNNVSCEEDLVSEIDYSEYFTENLDFANLGVCGVNNEMVDFENNKDFIDVIFSIKKDDDGNLVDKIIWAGYQNWPMNGKIIAQGVFENEFYKRVYYTDYINVFRSLNIRDTNLQFRKESEFNNFQNGVLLQPIIEDVSAGGQIRSSSCFYTYRLITENGQVTGFSAFSKGVKILPEDTAITFAGGDISESTNKKVLIKINIPDYAKFKEVECIAIEYEAKNSPTAIRSLGVKPCSIVTTFNHFGNEEEFTSNITISELTKRNNTWKYCSDVIAAKNKLITAGLRGEPMPSELSSITEDFALHSWDINGETHNCLINPKPWQYRYFDPEVTDSFYYLKQKVYNSINVFGSFTATLKNLETGEFVSFSFLNNSLVYVNQVRAIFDWLNLIKGTTMFQIKFPNLDLEFNFEKMLFKPINTSIQTDMDNYQFEYNTTQVFEDINKDLVFLPITVNTSNLVYGAVSLGFNKGNGIRISYTTKEEELLTKATELVEDDGILLHYKEPQMDKTFMKGEIYRTGLLFFDTSGNELFTIPLGDIMIPKHGEVKRFLADDGTIIIQSDYYKNSKVVGDKLYAEKINLRVEVRLSCFIQKVVSMYQLVYVERDEENRTILAQGISAPMERVQTFFHSNYISMPEEIDNKFGLPYYGGPTYDGAGLKAYDLHGENDDHSGYENSTRRVITHRGLFYFDSPDLIHSLISDSKINSGNIETVARLNTDHNRSEIRQSGGEVYPKFSRKIKFDDIDFGNDNYKPGWINVSVFSQERKGDGRSIPIYKSESLNEGQIISGAAFDLDFDVANNALTLARQSWFYSGYARKSHKCGGESGARSELFNSSNYSIGMETVVIKTESDVFTQSFISQQPFYPDGEVRLSGGLPTYDTHGLFNIVLGNRESVYGGRTEFAYSRNIWIPLSTTIPVLKTTNGSQIFKVEGDTYLTLFIRNKNYCSTLERGRKDMNNSGGCGNKNEEEDYTRTGAWCYAVVLETMVEPKLTYKDVFWREQNSWNFDGAGEQINECYFQETSLKSSISRPFRFKDDPNQNNVIAASNPKLNGNYFDDWSVFEPNNFYEIDKDKGTVFNLGKFLDEVYAIQEQQTSRLLIDERTMVPTNNGEISIKEGSGNVIASHEVVSDFGTSIRRALAEIISSGQIKGFSFFDEKRNEFIRIDKPLLIDNQLHLSIIEKFIDNPVIDTEGYFDDEFKESNIRLRTKNGTNIVLSFNEVFQCFNGWIEYDNDLYIMWNSDVFAPKTGEVEFEDTTRPDSSKLFQLNKGEYLNFFEEQKTMKLGVIVNQESGKIKIFKHWGGNINIPYNVKNITTKTSTGQNRVVQGTHHRYKIREEYHSVPLKNRTDWEDLRGKWMYLEVEIESIDNHKIDIFSFINFVRESYI